MSAVPKGWQIKPLSALAEIQTGLAKGKKPTSDSMSLPYLRVANVQDGYFDLNEIKLIEVEISRAPRYSLRIDDVLLTEGGDLDKLGRGSIWKGQIDPCLHQNHVFAVRVNKNVLLPYFFAQQTGSHYGKTYFLSCAKQTTNLASINSTQLKEFPVLLPPLEEQRKIAGILSTWDETIEQQTRLIELKRERKRGLMQQLLTGRVRFKEFEGLEWDHVVIGDIASLAAGGTPSTLVPEYWGGDIPWMSSGDIHKGRVYKVDGRITQKGLENSSTKYVPINSVLVALAGQGKTRATVAINKMKLCTNQSIAAIMLNPFKASYEYVFYNLQARYDEMRALSAGDGGRGGLNLSILRSIEIALPPLPEQQKIATVLATADAELETLTAQLEALKAQKRGLMQRLLTGKTRVQVA